MGLQTSLQEGDTATFQCHHTHCKHARDSWLPEPEHTPGEWHSYHCSWRGAFMGNTGTSGVTGLNSGSATHGPQENRLLLLEALGPQCYMATWVLRPRRQLVRCPSVKHHSRSSCKDPCVLILPLWVSAAEPGPRRLRPWTHMTPLCRQSHLSAVLAFRFYGPRRLLMSFLRTSKGVELHTCV